MRVVLHIGPQKTGTSYIQARLFKHRIRLARHGFHYHLPVLDENGLDPRGRPAVRSDLGENLAEGGFPAFAQEMAVLRDQGVECLVVSAEHLARLTTEQIAPLTELFANDQVEIYAYVRRWSERLPSAWWQQVSTGMLMPFPPWLAETYRTANTNWLVNESLLWSRWAAQFGRDRIHILSYDAMRAHKVDIFDDFLLTRLRFPGKIFPRQASHGVHARPPPLEVEIIQQLYRHAAARPFNLTPRVKHRVLRELHAAGNQPFHDIASGAELEVTIDDNNPAFAEPMQAMEAWADRLATSDLSPRIVDPKVSTTSIVPREALEGPAAQAAIAALIDRAIELAANPLPPRPFKVHV